jgi:hypothetical protein
MASEPIVRCVCNTLLAEPPNTPPEQRMKCPNCGSTARSFSITAEAGVYLVAGVSAELSVTTARPTSPPPSVETLPLEDAGFDVTWLRLSEGGAWMVRVFDRDGVFVDGGIADDPQDAILAVCERLLPGSEPAE